MKKSLFFAVAATVLSGCASDELVDVSVPNTGTSHSDIRFTISQKNTTRGYSDLNKTGHYNFGVFAYKSTDKVNSVMPNYLVGYYDPENGYGTQTGSTFGDQDGVADGFSYWMYEGMGNKEYNGTYAGGALTADYTSNNENQYLKYWDNAADYTCFYAYAPYINSGVKLTATYVDGTAQSATGADTYVLTIPNGTLKDGYDDPSLAEYMYASTKVEKANYGHDVALQFHRLNAKVNIKFWEDVPGWKVRILDLSSSHEGVQAAASVHDNTSGQYGYKVGKYYTSNGIKVQFGYANTPVTDPVEMQYKGVMADNTTTLKFKSPTVAEIGENRYEASASATTYYAIPKGQGNVLADGSDFNTTGVAEDADLVKTGFTFHVSYELTAQDTGEKIVVKNATVHVPYEYCNWKSNTHYTYIFKITRDSNGSTDENPTIDPTDPEVPTVQSLYPIVFDNCTVEEWLENESEWEITDGTVRNYHYITLSEGGSEIYSFKSDIAHTLTVAIADGDNHKNHGVDYSAVTVSGPQATTGWYDADAKTISVPANAAAGVYTVTYTCPAGDINKNHPATWTQTFFVSNAYTIKTHKDFIGTNSNEAQAKLNVSGTKDGASLSLATTSLSIDYPVNFSEEDKSHVAISGTDVVVKKTAKPGVYKVVYTIEVNGSKVKVADYKFTVVDYNFSLSHSVVFLDASPVVVKATVPAVGEISMTSTPGITVNDAAKTISVANTTAEGTYTVTYTVDGDNDAKTVYTKDFTVKNQYAVSLAKDNIDSMVGTAKDGDVSTDGIVVTLKKNGVVTTTDLTASLKVVASDAANTATADANFSFVWNDTEKNITLKVKRGAEKKGYKVVYTGQSDVYAVDGFVVK